MRRIVRTQSVNKLIPLFTLPAILICSAPVSAEEHTLSYLELGYLSSELELANQRYSGSGVQVKGAVALNNALRLVGHYDVVSFDDSNDLSLKEFGLGADYRFGLGAGFVFNARYEYVRTQAEATSIKISEYGNLLAGELLWSLPDGMVNLGSKRQLGLYSSHTRYSNDDENELGGEFRVYVSTGFSIGLAYQQAQSNEYSNIVISIREER